MKSFEAAYALGRLGFGAGLLGAPEPLGSVLLGDDAKQPSVRMTLRFYGTRDTALGLGHLRSLARGEGTDGWLLAGLAADLLDAVLQVYERDQLPPGKLVPGVSMALAAAAAGAALLSRHSP